MQAKAIYIVATGSQVEERVKAVEYFTDERDVIGYINNQTLYPDFVSLVIYKIECNEQEKARLLDTLTNQERVPLSRYTNVSHVPISLRTSYPLRFKPIPKPQEESSYQFMKELPEDLRKANNGDVESAKKVLERHSGRVALDVLGKLIYDFRRDPEIFGNVNNWLQQNNTSLSNIVMSSEETGLLLLSSRISRNLTPNQVADFAEQYPAAYLEAFRKTKIETNGDIRQFPELRDRIGRSRILRSLHSDMEAVAKGTYHPKEEERGREKEAEHPRRATEERGREKEKEKEPERPKQPPINFDTAFKNPTAAISYLRSNPTLPPESAATLIAQHAHVRGFLQEVYHQVAQHFIFNSAITDPKAAIKFLQNESVVRHLTPSQLIDIAYQHRYDKNYKDAVEGIGNPLHPSASLHAILNRAKKDSWKEHDRLKSIIDHSGGLKDLYKIEEIIWEKKEREREEPMHEELGFDPYEVLGVKRDASDAEIKKAYFKLAAMYHPDKLPEGATVGSRFIQAGKAYEVLSDKAQRAEYDRNHPEGGGRHYRH